MRGTLHTQWAVALFLGGLGLLLHGCGSGQEHRPPSGKGAIGDADIVRRSCAPSADVPGFRWLAATRRNTVIEGDCGELAWEQPDSNALHYLGLDGEPREVSPNGWALWFEDNRILYGDLDGFTLEDGGSMTRSWPGVGVGPVGKLPGGDSFWVCSRKDGILRLDEDGITFLTPDFLAPDGWWGSGCSGIDASPSGTIAYPTDLHRIGVVDALTGSTRTIDHPFYPYGTTDEIGLSRVDAVRLSPDGRLVFHGKYWEELRDHFLVHAGEGEIAVFEPDATEPARIPGVLGEAWKYIVSFPWQVWYGPWMATAPGVFVPSIPPDNFQEEDARLVGIGDPISLQGVSPRAIRGNHLFVETREGAGLLELGTGTFHHLMDAPSIGGVVPFRWGGPVAITHLTNECIRSPENPSLCHAQIWGLSLWREESRTSQVAFASQPISVYEIGPDGSMIVEGQFLSEQPNLAKPVEVPFSLRLLGAHGRVIRELNPESWIMDGIGGEHFAILRRMRQDGGVHSEELVAIDWKTGDETVLVSGIFASSWSLDHSDRRLSAIVSPNQTGLPEVWSGVVAR